MMLRWLVLRGLAASRLYSIATEPGQQALDGAEFDQRAAGYVVKIGKGAEPCVRRPRDRVMSRPLAIVIAACLLTTPAVAGDATHFLICRSDGCIDVPSLRFVPKTTAQPSPSTAPPPAPTAPAPQRDALSREIEADITEFCDSHPDEKFCGKLGLWLRQHPDPAH
jgi:hypothetical protein